MSVSSISKNTQPLFTAWLPDEWEYWWNIDENTFASFYWNNSLSHIMYLCGLCVLKWLQGVLSFFLVSLFFFYCFQRGARVPQQAWQGTTSFSVSTHSLLVIKQNYKHIVSFVFFFNLAVIHSSGLDEVSTTQGHQANRLLCFISDSCSFIDRLFVFSNDKNI